MPNITRSDREAARRPSLLECHGALSALHFAVTQTLDPICCDVVVKWQRFTDLSVEIEVRERDKQAAVDRLSQGALYDIYDYRFTVSYPTSPAAPDEWVTITAYPKLLHDDKQVKAAREKLAEAA